MASPSEEFWKMKRKMESIGHFDKINNAPIPSTLNYSIDYCKGHYGTSDLERGPKRSFQPTGTRDRNISNRLKKDKDNFLF